MTSDNFTLRSGRIIASRHSPEPIGSDPSIRRRARYGTRSGVLGSRQERPKHRWSGGSSSIDVGDVEKKQANFSSARLRHQPMRALPGCR
jgi:hypothetical protein